MKRPVGKLTSFPLILGVAVAMMNWYNEGNRMRTGNQTTPTWT
jgi:hypothetical protein